MNPRRRKNGTSKALPKRKKSDPNLHKNRAQASGSGSAQVSRSMISPEAQAVQREEEEESSQGIDSQQEDEGGNEDEDEDDTSNPDDFSGGSSDDDEDPSEASGLVIRIPLGLKRTTSMALKDKPRTDKGKKCSSRNQLGRC